VIPEAAKPHNARPKKMQLEESFRFKRGEVPIIKIDRLSRRKATKIKPRLPMQRS